MNKRFLKLLSLTAILLTTPVFSSGLQEEHPTAVMRSQYSLYTTSEEGDALSSIPVSGDLSFVRWEFNDENRSAQQIYCGDVNFGGRLRQRIDAPFNFAVPYTRLTSKKYFDDLVVGQTVNVYKLNRWKRPDDTVYRRLGEVLFRLRLDETRTPIVKGKSFCARFHDFEKSFWRIKNKFFHQTESYVHKYNLRKTITRIELNGNETIIRIRRFKVLVRS